MKPLCKATPEPCDLATPRDHRLQPAPGCSGSGSRSGLVERPLRLPGNGSRPTWGRRGRRDAGRPGPVRDRWQGNGRVAEARTTASGGARDAEGGRRRLGGQMVRRNRLPEKGRGGWGTAAGGGPHRLLVVRDRTEAAPQHARPNEVDTIFWKVSEAKSATAGPITRSMEVRLALRKTRRHLDGSTFAPAAVRDDAMGLDDDGVWRPRPRTGERVSIRGGQSEGAGPSPGRIGWGLERATSLGLTRGVCSHPRLLVPGSRDWPTNFPGPPATISATIQGSTQPPTASGSRTGVKTNEP
jgi:hypothetical protein